MNSVAHSSDRLSAYDQADEYLRIHLPHASASQMVKVKTYVYRQIELGTNYLKACHEALVRVDP